MMVYGDPCNEQTVGEMLHDIRLLTRQLTPGLDVDLARRLLILTGQLEQGLADIGDATVAAAMTDAAADLFLRTWQGVPMPPQMAASVLLQHHDALMERASERLRVKVPEGFAFYSLFPEQYALAAERWSGRVEERQESRTALIVGIRSIGCTLSAIVCAVLKAKGWTIRRVTVRPTGHPYDRQARLDSALAPEGGWALVVDEGPGRSGSSFAAVANALRAIGVEQRRIVFFPGHAGMPGDCGSAEVRTWWETTERVVVDRDAARWNGYSLHDMLAQETERCLGKKVVRAEDLGGGRWRSGCRADAPAWPLFEREKIRFVAENGRAILWKFAGLGEEATRASERLRERQHWTTVPVGTCAGFVGTEWVDGRLLRHDDVDNQMLQRLANYVTEAARDPLSDTETAAAADRLADLFYWNVREALGEEPARNVRAWSDRLRHRLLLRDRRYGDGRMGPWEWVKAADNHIVKVDAQGHDQDHTCVGAQRWLWDVAGICVEWKLNEAVRARLMQILELHDIELLRFYCAAYTAFRFGMSALCGTATDQDKARLKRMIPCGVNEHTASRFPE